MACILFIKYHYVLSLFSEFHTIFLGATCLQVKLFQYRISLPLQNPSIYLSSHSNQLPIVINAGAPFSITPTLADFTQGIVLLACSRLNQLSRTTSVTGEGPFSWNIEDVKETCQRIDTQAYYVPSATIHLFPPQTYIASNAKVKLVLNVNGTQYLTLKCETDMEFPLNSASNLPFMLTEEAVHENRKQHNAANFMPFSLSDYLFHKSITSFIYDACNFI